MALRTRVREEVARLSAKCVVPGAIERCVDPVAEELGPEMADTAFAKQARMLSIAEQTPGDKWIGDDPANPRRLPHRTGDSTQCQQAEERWIRGKNESRLVSRTIESARK